MTRNEQTNSRDLTVSKWIREKLPDSSTGFMVSDLDFIMYNYKTKKLMLLEIKQFGKQIPTWQRRLFNILHHALQIGLASDIEYLGFHLVRFEKQDFSGKIYFDNQELTETELINKLSF